MVPDLIETDNCPLRMFPVSFLISFCLLDFIKNNTFGIVQKDCTSDQATISRSIHCVVVVLSIFQTHLKQYLHEPPDPIYE